MIMGPGQRVGVEANRAMECVAVLVICRLCLLTHLEVEQLVVVRHTLVHRLLHVCAVKGCQRLSKVFKGCQRLSKRRQYVVESSVASTSL